MSTSTDTTTGTGPVVLFPGQGGFDGAALRRAHERHPQVRAVFDRVDTVADELFSRRLSPLLLEASDVELPKLLADEPWVSQLAIYGAALAAYRILEDEGLRPAVLAGHSLGEITALVAAGAFSVEDGARIVARRIMVIAESEGDGENGGAMVALAADPDRARHLVGLIGHPLLSVATENHDTQTVLSGPYEVVASVKAIADQLRISSLKLDSAFAFHNPALADVAPAFASFLGSLDRRPLTVPVYSPILGRFYEPREPLAERLAEHLTQPVRFSAAVRELRARGHRTFVEAGGRAVLTSLVSKVVRPLDAADGSLTTALPTLATGQGGALQLSTTLGSLRTAGLTGGGEDGLRSVRLHLVPDAPQEVFEAFWNAHRAELTEVAAGRLREFLDAGAPTAGADGTAGAPRAVAADGAAVPGREELLAVVRGIYAEALEYPEEVFTPEALLEAELGVDSVKQVELLARASRHYGLPTRASDFRLADYGTLDKIVTLIADELGARRPEPTVTPTTAAPTTPTVAPASAASAPVSALPQPAAAALPDREEILAVVRGIYAEALEYPEEVFTPEALLEAELGVDSVKQVELLARASRHYGLPTRASDFRLADYGTLDKIVTLIADELRALQSTGVAA
ncbi:acyltransferase domain-containing protein [Streptomyces sp. NPDC048606]|uniref:acyltransferase domain-containing protein n=1 Tax=Streptomyces sp. NPDC048606 TaxID=3154726 RepID=UPI00342EFB75